MQLSIESLTTLTSPHMCRLYKYTFTAKPRLKIECQVLYSNDPQIEIITAAPSPPPDQQQQQQQQNSSTEQPAAKVPRSPHKA